MPKIMKKNEPVQSYVSETIKLKLRKFCKRKDISESEAIRIALDRLLHNITTK